MILNFGVSMIVNNISATDGNLYSKHTYVKPTFTAVHPARYFVADDTGNWVRADGKDLIRTLQRKLIGYLNYAYNLSQRAEGSKIKKESDLDKTVRERLVRFFKNRDKDYRHRECARSVYDTTYSGDLKPYILTGNSVDVANENGKIVGEAKKFIRDKINHAKYQLNMTENEAKDSLSSGDLYYRKDAANTYYKNIRTYISNILKSGNPENSTFDAYFIARKKGKRVSYELVQATLNGK